MVAIKKTGSLALAAGAALALSACGTLIPPRHLSAQDVSGLSASQLSAARRYQQQIPQAKQKVDQATRVYERAQAQYQVAQKYWSWKNLEQEHAMKARDLAQARVELLQRQVQLARAQALAQNGSAKQIDVKKYRKRVHEQQAHIQALAHNVQQLQALASAAHTNYETARQNLGNGGESAPPAQSSGNGGAGSSSATQGNQNGSSPGLQTQPLQPGS